MSRTGRMLFGLFIVGLIVGGPVAYWNLVQSNMRNFRVVRDGVLYRSGQMSLKGLQQIIHDHGIKTVVTLRDSYYAGKLPPDWKEEQYCKSQEINYFRIPPRNFEAPDGSVPADEGVREFRAVMDDARHYPVLVHCFAGIHRTGVYCSIYRMEYEKWSNPRAIEEVRFCGYATLNEDWDALGFLERFQPRWKKN